MLTNCSIAIRLGSILYTGRGIRKPQIDMSRIEILPGCKQNRDQQSVEALTPSYYRDLSTMMHDYDKSMEPKEQTGDTKKSQKRRRKGVATA